MSNDLEREYRQFIESLRRDNKQRFHESAMRWNELANDRVAEVSKQLFTIATLVLPLSFFPITNNQLVGSLANTDKNFLVLSWILFILSLIFGLIHLSKESKFFNMWAVQEGNRSQIYSEGIFTTSAIKAYDRFDQMNKESAKEIKMDLQSARHWFYLQQITMVAGIIAITVILFGFLYSENNQFSHGKNQRGHYFNQRYFLRK